MKKTTSFFITILLLVVAAIAIYFLVLKNQSSETASGSPGKIKTVTKKPRAASATSAPEFVTAAREVTAGVVHIKSISGNSGGEEEMYGSDPRQGRPSVASGSGVIISADGYIATNNHVIENATEIMVILTDRREFEADLVGRDPNTDLALLKINGTELPVVALGNSDEVEVGEWVLAVGYPFSLNTTVTAGIISAKGRSIGIINTTADGGQQPGTAIESFIQTDAAINPGNSGGALVNTNGELIGINTAIASLTGSYAGYAFAIPVNLAKKILDDLKQFGSVQRGILGVSFPAPAAEDQYLKQQGITPGSVQGVYITDIQPNSGAAAAGLKEGDIIQEVDGVELFSSSEFSERIARHRPKDTVNITYLRGGQSKEVRVVLKGEERGPASTETAQSLRAIYEKLGAVFAPLTPTLKERFALNSGVVVTRVLRGGFFDQIGIPPGTIIAFINGTEVNNPKEIEAALLEAGNGRIQILGVAPDGSRVAFNFSLGA
ncbi:MAG: trypsin-like peptidase domain-containing protein [Ferruginibacter sp.]|nr:trypsin-like peptidase domain-containing protein [Ferruginibacter sp.]